MKPAQHSTVHAIQFHRHQFVERSALDVPLMPLPVPAGHLQCGLGLELHHSVDLCDQGAFRVSLCSAMFVVFFRLFSFLAARTVASAKHKAINSFVLDVFWSNGRDVLCHIPIG